MLASPKLLSAELLLPSAHLHNKIRKLCTLGAIIDINFSTRSKLPAGGSRKFSLEAGSGISLSKRDREFLSRRGIERISRSGIEKFSLEVGSRNSLKAGSRILFLEAGSRNSLSKRDRENFSKRDRENFSKRVREFLSRSRIEKFLEAGSRNAGFSFSKQDFKLYIPCFKFCYGSRAIGIGSLRLAPISHTK